MQPIQVDRRSFELYKDYKNYKDYKLYKDLIYVQYRPTTTH